MLALVSLCFAQDMEFDAGLDVDYLVPAQAHEAVQPGFEQWLVVEVKAPEIDPADAERPTHLSLVLDTSGSMKDSGKLEYAREAASQLVDRLRPGDTLSLIGFGSEPTVVRRQGRVLNPAEVVYAIGLLTPQGGTNIYGGLQQGLDQLQRFLEHPRRRVLLMSDGEATAGPTDRRSLAGLASDAQQAGVTVSTVGLGLEFDAPTLIAIADAGGGRYRYGNDPEEVVALFDEELKQMQQVAALSTTVELKLGEGVELIEVLGYEEYDGYAIDGGWRVLIGDMESGEPRKVVARVRVPGHARGEVDVARVDIAWKSPSTGAKTEKKSTITTRVEASAGAAPPSSASSARRRSKAAQASAGKALERAVELQEKGDRQQAAQVLEETLIEFSDELIEGELGDELEAIEFYRDQLVEPAPEAEAEEDRRMQDKNRLRALGYMY